MILFVDASALVAIVAGEYGAGDLADRPQDGRRRPCSAVSVWESVSALCRSYRARAADARVQVRLFLDAGGVEVVPTGAREAELAWTPTNGTARVGTRQGSTWGIASPNACAKAHGARLLHKGDDFSRAALAWAPPPT